MAQLDRIIAFVLTSKPEQAKAFYAQQLGFEFLRDDGFALVFNAHGTMLRIGKMEEFTPASHTVLGWEVPDITAAVRDLRAAGVEFQYYDFMHPDSLGICTFPTGDKVAWFKDPDGNVLSLSQHAIAAQSADAS